MPRIGVTGHSNLSAATVSVVVEVIRHELQKVPGPLTGVSCLARGADQVFAQEILNASGSLEVVLPAADYRERKVKPDNVAQFDDLIDKASEVITMPFATSNRDAYMAASEYVLGVVDTLVAVWDGQPAGGHGGTGDVVQAAHARGIPVTVIWPEGATRQ